ncbi:MAG: enoyl-CoA hydratase/isomerase [Pseudomonadales bacterium]|jgi:2-(1,2-epoxy-1,2-dihydrophenyl)acetyl-CoA isomerase|nr:enoyl-CoA hydratase/isomerase [Pseudomonadales bacterium]MDP4641240.1 enoyl-CoA hydratase/isomerase [Pseudomonadales bacterium]MDP5060113.1 enoyl-CoA hydratase/isomerase [Pseudomonadales bacterium]
MDYKTITLSIENKIAVLTLNAPDVLNALSGPMVEEISAALTAVGKPDSGVRCLVMTGAGRAFCAGANLQARPAAGAPVPAGHILETHYAPVLNKIRLLPFPFVSAVNGPAVGVGMSFAIMADMVVAAKSAYFLQAFANIGLIPDGGATWFLPRMIGWGRAAELSLMAERLSAEKAESWGLVNRVVDDADLMAEAMKIATKLANGPMSLGLIRKAYWESQTNSFNEQLQLEATLQMQAGASRDNREGVQAFLEKRSAKFEGI